MKILSTSAAARALAAGKMLCCLETDEWFQLHNPCSVRAARRRMETWRYYDPKRKTWGIIEEA